MHYCHSPMPRAPADESDELGAMPTTTAAADASSAAPNSAGGGGDAAEQIKHKLAAAAAAAKPVVQKLAVTTSEGAKKGLEIGKAKAEEMTSSVATAEKRAALMVDTKVRAATLVAAGQQQVVRGQALLAKTPGVGQGAVAERLGIEYESPVEGEFLFGYDAELVSVLRQFDQSTAVLRSLVQVTDETGAAFASLAASQTLIEHSASAEHARLEAVPPDHVTRSKPSRSLRPSAEKVAAEEARYSLLIGELGQAYGALSAASTQLVEGVAAMRERAAVIAEKVVADVLLTIGAHGRWVQDHYALHAQVEGLRAADKDVTHAEARVAEVGVKVVREREGVLLKVKLLEDKRREMMKRWLLDYMGMQSRFYSAGALCFPSRPDLAQAPGTAPSHAAATAAGTASPESVAERARLRGGYPSPGEESEATPAPAPAPAVDYSQYYSSSAAGMVEQTQQAAETATPAATAPAPTQQEEEEEAEDAAPLESSPQQQAAEPGAEEGQATRPSTPPRPEAAAPPAPDMPAPSPAPVCTNPNSRALFSVSRGWMNRCAQKPKRPC